MKKVKIPNFLILIGSFCLLFFGIPPFILYSKYILVQLILVSSILFVVPYFIYKTGVDFKLKKKTAQTIALFSVLIIGPSFGLWGMYISERDLTEHKGSTKGVVINSWPNYKNSHTEWLFKAEFTVDKKKYQTFSQQGYRNLKVGDTVEVIYSTKNPANNKAW